MSDMIDGSLPHPDPGGLMPLPARSIDFTTSPADRLSKRNWVQQYRAVLATVDFACIVIAAIVGYRIRFSAGEPASAGLNYLRLGPALVIGWMTVLQSVGAYEIRHLANGPTESKLVLRGSTITAGILAIFCYATKTEVARGLVIGVIPIGTVLLLIGRAATRRYVTRKRATGAWVHRILAVGTSESVQHLLKVTERATGAGLLIVGACVEDAAEGESLGSAVRVLGGVRDAAEVAERIAADVIAVTANGLGPSGVRELGWKLEGTGRGLVLAPALTEIAGPRVHVSPVEGLPLVWLEQPQLGRVPKITKRALDVIGASGLLVLAVPLLLVSACAIAMTSRGPVVFRQRRLGIHGSEFMVWKLRSMYVGADTRRGDYLELNEQDGGGVLFKIKRDPRVTPVGRWLRRFSIDELPQLVHVLSGRMSLVGPRPLAAIDSTYTGFARRRLLVRPGLTGLWQVSGRSGLSWEDSVRLDLYYVENWSLALDLAILGRTVVAVLGRAGAY